MIVVFDAQCLLCKGCVQFLLRHDRKGIFQFAARQGVAEQMLLTSARLTVDGLETLLLIDWPRTWHTGAILRVLGALGWPWRPAWIAWLVPAQIRNPLYRMLARKTVPRIQAARQMHGVAGELRGRFLD